MANPVRADKRKFHYIYKITRNDASSKFYIGMHSTDNLNDGYFGSGKLLWLSIKKYGRDLHTKEILEFLPSRSLLKEREKELVNQELLDNPQCMNLQIGGYGGNLKKGYKWSDEAKQKLSETRKGKPGHQHTEETKAKIQASAKACIEDGRMKTWATSLTKEERGANVTKGNKSRAKKLYAYSPIDGSFVKEFPPFNDTIEMLQIKVAHLSLALKDKRFPCGGYLWSHEQVHNLGVTEKDVMERALWASRPKSARPITQIFPDGSTKIWESMQHVIRELGGHQRKIEKIIQTGAEWNGCTWSG